MSRTTEPAGSEFTLAETLWVQQGTLGVLELIEQASAPSPILGTGLVYTKISDGDLYFKDSSGVEHNLLTGSGGVAGLNTQVQYNNAGAFGASADFTWDNGAKILTVNGKLTVTGSIDPTDVILSGIYQHFSGAPSTGTDTNGQTLFVQSATGTGTGAGGPIEFDVAPAGTISGITPGILAGTFKLHSDFKKEFVEGFLNHHRILTDTTGNYTGFEQDINVDSPVNSADNINGVVTTTNIQTGNTSNYTGNIGPVVGQFNHQGTGTIGVPNASGAFGVNGGVHNDSTGIIEIGIGILSLISSSGAGTIVEAVGHNSVFVVSGGTMTNAIGYLAVSPLLFGGTIDNAYGILIQDHSGKGTVTDQNISSLGLTSKNLFEGRVLIGTTDITITGKGVVLNDDATTDALTAPTTFAIVNTTGTGLGTCAVLDFKGASDTVLGRIASHNQNVSAGDLSVITNANGTLFENIYFQNNGDNFMRVGNKLAIGNPGSDASAIFDLTSTTLGFLEPRMNTAARDAIPAPATGLQIYNTDTNQLNYYNGAAWVALASAGAGYIQGGNAFGTTAILGTIDNFDQTFITNSVEHVRITTGGFVGINTTTPQNFLHVYGVSATTNIEVESDTAGQSANLLVKNPNQFWYVGIGPSDGSDNFQVYDGTNNVARLVIDPTGIVSMPFGEKLGVGTNTPGAGINVYNSNASEPGLILDQSNGEFGSWMEVQNNTDGSNFRIISTGPNVFSGVANNLLFQKSNGVGIDSPGNIDIMALTSTGVVLVNTTSQIDPNTKARLQVDALTDGSQYGIYVHGLDYLSQFDTAGGSATMFGFLSSSVRKWDMNLNTDDFEWYPYASGNSIIFGGNGFIGVGNGTATPTEALDINGNQILTGTLNAATTGGNVIIGGGATASELRLLEASGSGTNYTAFTVAPQAANITYTLPVAVGAANTVLTDAAGNGTLSWAAPTPASNLIATITTPVAVASATGAQTLFSITIPANTLGSTGAIRVKAFFDNIALTSTKTAQFTLKYGGTQVGSTVLTNSAAVTISALSGTVEAVLIAAGATNSQVGSITESFGDGTVVNNLSARSIVAVAGGAPNTLAVDSTVNQTLLFTVTESNNSASDTTTMNYATIESI